MYIIVIVHVNMIWYMSDRCLLLVSHECDDVVLAVVVEGEGAGGPIDVGVEAVEPGGAKDEVEPFEGGGVEGGGVGV